MNPYSVEQAIKILEELGLPIYVEHYTEINGIRHNVLSDAVYQKISGYLNRANSNENRSRCYGLCKGDIVSPKTPSGEKWHKGNAEVIEIFTGDNNRVVIRANDGTQIDWVAEWCDIIIKVEDR